MCWSSCTQLAGLRGEIPDLLCLDQPHSGDGIVSALQVSPRCAIEEDARELTATW